MSSLLFSRNIKVFRRNFSTTNINYFKVAVAGAAGGIGQPLSLLLKLHRLITQLSICDKQHAIGVAVDLSHICTPCEVSGYTLENVSAAFANADIVVVAAGVPRKPGMSRDDLFSSNAEVVKTLTRVAARSAPNALLAILTNPINSVIPIAAEILKLEKTYNPNKLFGVTALDGTRAATFIAEVEQIQANYFKIPVIGGHSPETMVPLFSQSSPQICSGYENLGKIITRVQNAGSDIVKAKQGKGSATLSMAYATFKFCDSLLRGLKGERDVVDCAYVPSKIIENVPFLATPIRLGKNGIEENLGLGDLHPIEQELLTKAIPVLRKNIQKGIDYVCVGGTSNTMKVAKG